MHAEDEQTITFRLVAPAPYFLAMLNRPDCGPQPRHAIETLGDAWAEPGSEVVSGAYRRTGADDLVLQRRSDYQGARTGNVREVRWVRDWYEKLIAAFEAEQLDLLWIRGHYLSPGFERLPSDRVRFEPAAFLVYLVLNFRKAQTADVRHRLGLAHGIDRSIWPEALPEYMTPARGGVVPPALSGHTPDIVPPFDPDLSSRRLAESEVRKVRLGLPELDEHVYSYLVESVATMWERVGPNVEIIRSDPRSAPGEEYEVDVFPGLWSPGYTDPEYYLRLLLHSQAADNFGRFSDPAFDELVDRATQERDERRRLALFHQADRMAVAEKAAVIPMVYARNISVSRLGVEGWWEFGKSWANFADLVVP